MNHPRARVYYRLYLPSEAPPDSEAAIAEGDPRWRDSAIMDFVHDSHSRCEMIQLPTQSEAALMEELHRRHPASHIIVDKINWLEYETAGP